MFGIFGKVTATDPVLGELKRAKGQWRGTTTLSGAIVPLAISGSDQSPDPNAVDAVRRLQAKFEELQRQIVAAIFEHYEPCGQA